MFKWIYFHILFVIKLGLIVMQMITIAAVTSQNWGKGGEGAARKRKKNCAEIMVRSVS
jgi:hypothetical protein